MFELILTGPPGSAALGFDDLTARYAPDRSSPSIRMNFIASIDGAVSVDGVSAGLGGEADKRVFGILRMHADAIMVGAGTLRTENYRAVRLDEQRRSWRASAGLPEYPRLVVVSGSLDLRVDHPALTAAPVRPLIITHASSDDEQRDALSEVADVLVHGVDRVDLRSAAAELRDKYALGQVLCEGGPHLFGALQAAGLVDELCLTVSPVLVGAGAERIVAGLPAGITEMRLVHVICAEDTLLLRYSRV